MAIDQSQKALEEALRELYADEMAQNYQPYDAPMPPIAQADELEGVGLIIHYSIKSIMDAVKQKSFFRAKHVLAQDKPLSILAVTSDDEDMLKDAIKDAIRKVFRAISHASKYVTDPNPLEDNPDVTVYTDQSVFERGSLWSITEEDVTTIYRCITDTESPPSEDSLDWMTIEDGDTNRVYFIVLLDAYWDVNYTDSLDTLIFNAIVAFILKEWYEITGIDTEVLKWQSKFDNYLSDARMVTFKRTRGIRRYCSPI